MFVTYALSAICLLFPCADLPQDESTAAAGVVLAPVLQHYEGDINGTAEIVEILQNPHMTHFQDNPNIVIPSRTDPVVYISDGGLRGFNMKTLRGRDIEAYQGIPFALPPVGPLRFKEPQENYPWRGIRDAVKPSPTCLQTDFIQQYKIVGQEDCLYLNVYRPVIARSNRLNHIGLPVLVFIHGGGFYFGSSNLYGPAYLLEEDIILVSINYRLGPLGFLALGDTTSPGNAGLKDQVMALKWVQENIFAFGGDPYKVTLFGESAGAGSVHYHMLSPLSRGLFQRGISQSGCALCFWSISENAVDISKMFSSRLGCTGSSPEIIDCLQSKNATNVVATQLSFLEWGIYPVVVFGPVVEPAHAGAFLYELPEETYKRGAVAPKPWISGFNSEEGAINIATLLLNPAAVSQLNDLWDEFGPIFLDVKHSSDNFTGVSRRARQFYLGNESISFENRDKAGQMFSDRYTVACGMKGLRFHSKYTDAPTYTYYLSHRGKYSYLQLLGQNATDWGVSHLDDLIYLVNNTAHYPTLKAEDAEYRISQIMTNMWANFAATGTPLLTVQGQDKEIWKPIDSREEFEFQFLNIDLNPRMIMNPFAERARFWRNLKLINE